VSTHTMDNPGEGQEARPTIHTIPVPGGWSPEQAWEAIKRGDLPLPTPPKGWANIETVAGYYTRLHTPEGPHGYS
jgi:hypothetical protein